MQIIIRSCPYCQVTFHTTEKQNRLKCNRAECIKARRAQHVELTFWVHVDKTSSPIGCWLWTGGKDPNGYGKCTFNGVRTRAHRVAYELVNGTIPNGFEVCHNCPNFSDNPTCCNPLHLFLGTHADNMRDMTSKGRGYFKSGADSPLAKLTDKDVLKIKSLYETGYLQREIADFFGVSKATISHIITGRNWKETI